MKVVQLVTTPQRRGAEVFAFQLTRSLRRLGCEARIVYLYGSSGEQNLPVSAPDLCLDAVMASPFERVPGFNPRLLWALAREVCKEPVDVLQVNGSRTVKYGALLRMLSRDRPRAVIYRNIGHPDHWSRGARRTIYRHVIMPRVDGVVAVSRTTLDAARDAYGFVVPSEHIPRGVDPEALVPGLDRGTLREKLGAPADARVLVYVGSLTPEKRVDRLLDAYSNLLQEVPATRLWIVGSGPLGRELEQSCVERNLTERVTFLGATDRVADYLHAADVFALTSDTEGLPGVLLEAGLAGIPVVATDVGGVSECVLNGETGLLVPRTDRGGLLDALRRLVDDDDLAARMGARARSWISERFHIDKVGRAYVDFYQRVLAESGRIPQPRVAA